MQLDIAPVVRRKIRVLGSCGARAAQDVPAVIDLVARGRVRLEHLVTDSYASEDAGRAYRDLDARRIRGRAVVTMDPGA